MGRKIELTYELIDHHARCREEGVPIAEACRLAGHGVSVFYRWVREAEEWPLLERMNELGLFDEDTWAPEPADSEGGGMTVEATRGASRSTPRVGPASPAPAREFLDRWERNGVRVWR